jgi:hypothetical protein
MTSSTQLVLRVIELLERLAIPYMLVGSYSSNFYGRPRSTKDADFVITISDDQLTRLRTSLLPDFHLDAQMSFETVTMHTRHIITHPESAFKVELFLLSDDAFSQERFRRRRRVDFEGHLTWLPTAEDVVVQKVKWGNTGRRSKDIEDVLAVLKVQGRQLDLAYIRRWCDEHGTRGLFEDLLKAAEGTAPQ